MLVKFISAIAGIWLMVAPSVLGFDKTIANNDHIIGPVNSQYCHHFFLAMYRHGLQV